LSTGGQGLSSLSNTTGVYNGLAQSTLSCPCQQLPRSSIRLLRSEQREPLQLGAIGQSRSTAPPSRLRAESRLSFSTARPPAVRSSEIGQRARPFTTCARPTDLKRGVWQCQKQAMRRKSPRDLPVGPRWCCGLLTYHCPLSRNGKVIPRRGSAYSPFLCGHAYDDLALEGIRCKITQ
jgi:hypothetical protein